MLRNEVGGLVNCCSIGYIDNRMLYKGARGAVGTKALYTIGDKAR